MVFLTLRLRIPLLAAAFFAGQACASVNFTLKPDTLQSGDVVILGRWERFERVNYQPLRKQEWDLSCLGRVDHPDGRRAMMQLGYYPDDLLAVRLPSPVASPLSISVECSKIVANTETAYSVPGGRELGLYRDDFESDAVYVMPPMKVRYQRGEIIPYEVAQDDSPAAAKRIVAEMLEYWPQFAERKTVFLKSSIAEDY